MLEVWGVRIQQMRIKPRRVSPDSGLVIIYTGSGKGKTTAALGTAIRAAGYGQKIAIVQFIKGTWKTGEMESLKRLKPEIELFRSGRGFVGILDDRLPRAEHRRAAHETLELARRLFRKSYDLVILDEINYAIHLHLLSVSSVITLLETRPSSTSVILTGNHSPPSLLRIADLVTEMHEIKHPYQQGIPAKRGIDY